MPLFTASRLQIATYLLGVCPFSIAFLVFLNSSISFVVTDLIGQQDRVGDAVGNLGFADELVALIACPFWGLLSDRVGIRTVCVIGYFIIFLALIIFVQTKNVYPQLLLARLFFSLGGAAASTMVTAVLPTMSYVDRTHQVSPAQRTISDNRHNHAASVASELTITPARFQSSTRQPGSAATPTAGVEDPKTSTSKIAGFVGMFTGLGALLALFVFLPLPALFQDRGLSPVRALQHSYYIVAAVALVIAIICLFGFRNLKSEKGKGFKHLLYGTSTTENRIQVQEVVSETAKNAYQALLAGFKRTDIGIGYLGGFVARASSVGISLFIPLLVNSLFLSSGLCESEPGSGAPGGLPDIKRRCPRAYIVASALTGAAETVALIAAPCFGYWSARTNVKSAPLATAAIAGVIGYPLFAARFDPHDDNKSDRAIAFVAACLIGFSQIGAIVCSLASLSMGVLTDSSDVDKLSGSEHSQNQQTTASDTDLAEAQPLLKKQQTSPRLSELKGSVAGIYSFYGGAAILLLTKAGGTLFDKVSTGAPFYIMATFNGILLLATIVVGMNQFRTKTRS